MIHLNFSEYNNISPDNKSEEYLQLRKLLDKGRKHNLYLKFKDGVEFSENNKGQIYTSLKIVVPQIVDYLLGRGVPEGVEIGDLYKVCRLDGWGKGVPADIAILRNLILYLTGETVEIRRQPPPNEFYQGFDSGLDLSESFIEIWNNNVEDFSLNRLNELSGENSDSLMELERAEERWRFTGAMEQHLNLIVEGVAGSGKSHMLQELRESGVYGENGSQIEVVVFHPSTSYEEFVSGIRPNFMKNKGEGDFVSQEGIFVQMCNWAALNPKHKFLIFIDEINRANTARVFGDLMLVLEKSKRQEFKDLAEDGRDGALFEASVQKMPGDYVRLQTPVFKNGKEYNKLAVPTNLHVLGTMNTTDRSVGTIDLALRRRFHWVSQPPYTDDELKTAMEKVGEVCPDKVATWYSDANAILLTEVGPDARLGHAYFFGKDGKAEAIAEALVTQLLEIIFTFNIKEDVLKKIGLPPISMYVGSKLDYEGQGLGRRPIVKEDKGKSPTVDGGSDSENEVSGNTDSENSQGDQ